MTVCPECGNPPAYTSFCTRCARLFMAKTAKHMTPRALGARRVLAGGPSAKALADRLGCSLDTVYRWRRAFGLVPWRKRKIHEDAHP